jgi:hypothetical protein
MANNRAPQSNPRGITRVPALGSPFEISNNSNRVPQTLNYVDCYPVKEEQFGENPIYQVAKREAFRAIIDPVLGVPVTFNLATINLANTAQPFTGIGGTYVNNSSYNVSASTGTAPNTLSGYSVLQMGQLLVLDEDDSGTLAFCNILVQNPSFIGGANASFTYAIISLNITVSGASGNSISVVPSYVFFSPNAQVGLATAGLFSVTPAGAGPGVLNTNIDPYYVVNAAGSVINITYTGFFHQNIFQQAGSPTTDVIVNVTVPAGNWGTIQTGAGWVPGSVINLINNGSIAGAGGKGGGPYSAGLPGSPAIILQWPMTITNNGIIGGGGGGGAGGFSSWVGGGTYGPGGGGGAGFNLAAGGVGVGPGNANGAAGTFPSGGNGGAPNPNTPFASAGNGGYAGSPGGNGGINSNLTYYAGGGGGGGGLGNYGGTAFNNCSGGNGFYTPGGAPGNAIELNGFACNIPAASYNGATAYGTIYGVVG